MVEDLCRSLEDAANPGSDVHLQDRQDLSGRGRHVGVEPVEIGKHPGLDRCLVEVANPEPRPQHLMTEETLRKGRPGREAIVLRLESSVAVAADATDLQDHADTCNGLVLAPKCKSVDSTMAGPERLRDVWGRK